MLGALLRSVWDTGSFGKESTIDISWMRQHDLSNRVFEDGADIDRACHDSWNKLTLDRLKTITATDWLTHEC